jgi:hypothetical protein
MVRTFKFEIAVNGDQFEEVHEQIFYDSLYRHVSKITPLIRKMLRGETIQFAGKYYKISVVEIY